MKNEETARRLKEALSAKNMLPSELAERSGVSKSSISQYMNGTYIPSNLSSKKMSDVLDVDPLWLMGFDIPMDYVYQNDKMDVLIEVQKSLNEEGMKRLLSYAQDLIASGRYSK